MTKPEGYWEKLKAKINLTLEKLKTKQAEKRAEWAEYKQWKAERQQQQTIQKTDDL